MGRDEIPTKMIGETENPDCVFPVGAGAAGGPLPPEVIEPRPGGVLYPLFLP